MLCHVLLLFCRANTVDALVAAVAIALVAAAAVAVVVVVAVAVVVVVVVAVVVVAVVVACELVRDAVYRPLFISLTTEKRKKKLSNHVE